VTVDNEDVYVYCGTRTGDIIELAIQNSAYSRNGPVHRIFKGGIFQINCTFGSLIVSCANGCIAKINKKTMVFEEERQLNSGAVVALTSSSDKIYALTQEGNLFSVDGDQPLGSASLFAGSMTTPVSEIVFP
jgi:hypothetical protein